MGKGVAALTKEREALETSVLDMAGKTQAIDRWLTENEAKIPEGKPWAGRRNMPTDRPTLCTSSAAEVSDLLHFCCDLCKQVINLWLVWFKSVFWRLVPLIQCSHEHTTKCCIKGT